MMTSPFKIKTSTFTNFDGYDSEAKDSNNNGQPNIRLAVAVDGIGEPHLNPLPLRAVPALMHAREDIPKALIIESLIKLLCEKYESDRRRARRLFKAICEILHKSQFLDQSLLFHEFKPTRRFYSLNFDKLFTTVRESLPYDNLTQDMLLSVGTLIQNFHTETAEGAVYIHSSQYLTEFEEECCIGKGGFGIVCKARKKMDQHDYAIKKIPFDHSKDYLFIQIQREVTVFAKLSHPNIVSYKTAWIEQNGADVIFNLVGSEGSLTSDESEYKRSDCEVDIVHATETLDEVELMETDDVQPLNMPSNGPQTLQRSLSVQQQKATFASGDAQGVCYSPAGERIRRKSKSDPSGDACRALIACADNFSVKNSKSVLFVQMELCQENLRTWLDNRLEIHAQRLSTSCIFDIVDQLEVITIFKQIVEGVAYLHEHQLVHRDLKPQNIMFDEHRVAKIGDFGLATVCCKRDGEQLRPWVVASSLTSGVGTSPYAAPEQRDGSNYNSKADMYSLGVILFELFVPFSTRMERAIVLKDLEDGKIAADVCERYPQQVELILQLVNKNPDLRPSSKEILCSTVFLSKDQLIKELTKENIVLKKKLLDAEWQILELNKLLGIH